MAMHNILHICIDITSKVVQCLPYFFLLHQHQKQLQHSTIFIIKKTNQNRSHQLLIIMNLVRFSKDTFNLELKFKYFQSVCM